MLYMPAFSKLGNLMFQGDFFVAPQENYRAKNGPNRFSNINLVHISGVRISIGASCVDLWSIKIFAKH